MKKTITILLLLMMTLLFSTTASALSILASFESTGTIYSTIEMGEQDQYSFNVIMDPHSTLEVEANLFRITNGNYELLDQLLTDTHASSIVYSSGLQPITQNEYEEPGHYMIDIHASETTLSGVIFTKAKQLYLEVQEQETPNQAPIADFTYAPDQPDTCSVTTFISTSYDPDGHITNEKWYINGVLVHEGVNETTFNYEFQEPGIYTVSIIVTDNEGAEATKTRHVPVTLCEEPNIPPVANFTYEPDQPDTCSVTTFTSTSYDPDGHIINEKWYINGVQIQVQGNNETTFDYEFTTPGNYDVKLVVTDNEGAESSITKVINVIECEPLNIPPVANFTYEPDQPDTCSVTTFTSTSYDPDGYITNEKWYIDGFLVHEGINETTFDYEFQEPRTYEIIIRVTDNQGAEDFYATNINVIECEPLNIPPVANFTYEPDQPEVGEEVTFISTSYDPDGFIIREKWFINGASVHDGINETSFTYTFQELGTYSVVLHVMDNEGAVDTMVKTIKVSQQEQLIPPVASFIYEPTNFGFNEEVIFTSTSYDPDGYITNEKWFINGVLVHEGINETSFTHIFEKPINELPITLFEVTLVVTDNDNLTDETSKTFDLSTHEFFPIADFEYLPVKPDTCDEVVFKSTSYAVQGYIVKEKWFINEELVHEGNNQTSFTYVFEEAKIHYVKIVVTDNEGRSASETKRIKVSQCGLINMPPVANFTYVPEHPGVGEEVTFSSTSYDLDGFIIREKWYINQELVYQGINETSFNAIFPAEGVYEVKLVVEDNEGETSEKIKNVVIVSEEEPEGLFAIISGPESPIVGTQANYDGSNSYDVTGAEIVLYEWTLVHNGVIIHQESSSQEFSYTFPSPGYYYLTLTVTNEHGEQASITMTIYASRAYGQYGDEEEQQGITIDYHYVYGVDYGIVETNEYFTVYITVTNRGTERLRNMRTTFALPEYGLSDRSGFFDLRAGETKTVEFHTMISDFDYIPTGYHDLLLGVAGQGITRYKYFPMTLQ